MANTCCFLYKNKKIKKNSCEKYKSTRPDPSVLPCLPTTWSIFNLFKICPFFTRHVLTRNLIDPTRLFVMFSCIVIFYYYYYYFFLVFLILGKLKLLYILLCFVMLEVIFWCLISFKFVNEIRTEYPLEWGGGKNCSHYWVFIFITP